MTRLSPERLQEIRAMRFDWWNQGAPDLEDAELLKIRDELLAEIDALTQERDDYMAATVAELRAALRPFAAVLPSADAPCHMGPQEKCGYCSRIIQARHGGCHE